MGRDGKGPQLIDKGAWSENNSKWWRAFAEESSSSGDGIGAWLMGQMDDYQE